MFQRRRKEGKKNSVRKKKKKGSLTQMKRFQNSPTGLSPVEKEKRITSLTMPQSGSRSSLTSTTSSVRKELDRALAFEKPPNGPMRDRLTIDILKIDGEDFKGTISPIEAKNLIYQETLGLERNLLHGLDISFKGHPVITFRLKEQINVDTFLESEDFVFERDSGSGRQNSWVEDSESERRR